MATTVSGLRSISRAAVLLRRRRPFAPSSRRPSSSTTKVDAIKTEVSAMGGGSVALSRLDSPAGVARMTLSNAAKRNALSGKMMGEMHDCAGQLGQWCREGQAAKAVLVCAEDNPGTGNKVVCSGGDLDVVRNIMDPEAGHRMSTLMHATLLRLRSLPVPTAFLVDGRALGGGAELTLHTDLRLFTSDGKIGFVQADMGVATGWGGGARLVEVVGQRNALKLLLSCKSVGAEEASALGLCDAILDVEDNSSAVDAAEQYLTNLVGRLDPRVVQAATDIVRNGGRTHLPLEERLAHERAAFKTVWAGEAHKSAMERNIKH